MGERITGLSKEVWPEYNLHGDVLNRYWGELYDLFPEYQVILYDHDADDVLAEAHTIPVVWDGELAELGPGVDASITAAWAEQLTANPGGEYLAREMRP